MTDRVFPWEVEFFLNRLMIQDCMGVVSPGELVLFLYEHSDSLASHAMPGCLGPRGSCVNFLYDFPSLLVRLYVVVDPIAILGLVCRQ